RPTHRFCHPWSPQPPFGRGSLRVVAHDRAARRVVLATALRYFACYRVAGDTPGGRPASLPVPTRSGRGERSAIVPTSSPHDRYPSHPPDGRPDAPPRPVTAARPRSERRRDDGTPVPARLRRLEGVGRRAALERPVGARDPLLAHRPRRHGRL